MLFVKEMLISLIIISGGITVADITENISTGYAESLFELTPPGSESYDKALVKKLEQAKTNRNKDYHPRTKHLRPDGWAKYTNRLFLESSP